MKTQEQLMNAIKICLEETCWEDVEWTNLVQETDKQEALVAATMNFRIP